MNIETIARNANKWFKNVDLEVGNTLSNFVQPSLIFLLSIIAWGELSLFVDGELEFCYVNATARGLGEFINACRNISLTLEERVYRIGFLIPTRSGYVLFERFIIPTIDGTPIRFNPSCKPIDVVVLPSPAFVGVIAVTKTNFPFSLSFNSSMIDKSIFALSYP